MEENSIRFEDIPNAITGVLKKLSSLEDKIDGIYELVQSEKEETWFTVAELCAYLPTHPVEHTIYCWTSNREIPFHKRGKRIMFLKSEIDEWLHNQGQIEERDSKRSRGICTIYTKKE
ncbi:helix-turn-helix domain-containing protein [Bacteroides thetaiotaomicron]|nr:helix-turn-helix domain-containing protein [Phocaeicola dorei]UVV54981.1 helix-turn-helix domain-containing protein [Bacteroides thetaiotaomicron]